MLGRALDVTGRLDQFFQAMVIGVLLPSDFGNATMFA
jgi:hypothetical protein